MKKESFTLLLVAMSGVRVKDKELLSLGMTLPGFVERCKVIASLPSLSLLTVAAYTPELWHLTYKEIDDLRQEEINACVDKEYDLIGISAFTARILDAYTLADSLRRQGCRVVLGGLHVSVLPEEAQLHADAVVVGEAEPVWETLIHDFEAGALKKLYRSQDVPKRFQLHDARIPRYDLLDIEKYNRITLQTTRGCLAEGS